MTDEHERIEGIGCTCGHDECTAPEPRPDAGGGTATISLPKSDAAEVLRKQIAQIAAKLPGRDGLSTPAATLDMLRQLQDYTDQYAGLFDEDGTDDGDEETDDDAE